MGKNEYAGHRRSTGQRLSGRLNNTDPPPKNYTGGFGSSSSGGGSGGDKKLSDRSRDKEDIDGKSRKDSQRALLIDGEELVDGWPKWLTDNVPKKVLAGLVPKSAENYDKVDKVSFFSTLISIKV